MKSCFRYLQLGAAYHVGGIGLYSLRIVCASSSDCNGFEVKVWWKLEETVVDGE